MQRKNTTEDNTANNTKDNVKKKSRVIWSSFYDKKQTVIEHRNFVTLFSIEPRSSNRTSSNDCCLKVGKKFS